MSAAPLLAGAAGACAGGGLGELAALLHARSRRGRREVGGGSRAAGAGRAVGDGSRVAGDALAPLVSGGGPRRRAVRAAVGRLGRALGGHALGALRLGAPTLGAHAPGAAARGASALGANGPGGLPARMAAAGVDAPVGDIVALRVGLALLAALAATPLAAAAPGRLWLAIVLAAPAGGFVAPEVWLRRRTGARRRAMEAELADVLDLLRVAVAAGLPPRRALAEVGSRHAGVLGRELRRTAERVALGEPSERALADLRARSPAAGVAAFVGALARAERHGAPLAATLAAQAAEARSLRAQRTAEAAARAAPKIQLVVALLLVPAVLLLVAAALIPALGGR